VRNHNDSPSPCRRPGNRPGVGSGDPDDVRASESPRSLGEPGCGRLRPHGLRKIWPDLGRVNVRDRGIQLALIERSCFS
jgi:hypothetical protein